MAFRQIGTLRMGTSKKEPDKDEIKRLAALGFNRRQIARKMRVKYSTLCNYIASKESYAAAYRDGQTEFKERREKFIEEHGGGVDTSR